MVRREQRIQDETKLSVARAHAQRHVELLREANEKADPAGEIELPEDEYKALEEELTRIFARHAAA